MSQRHLNVRFGNQRFEEAVELETGHLTRKVNRHQALVGVGHIMVERQILDLYGSARDKPQVIKRLPLPRIEVVLLQDIIELDLDFVSEGLNSGLKRNGLFLVSEDLVWVADENRLALSSTPQDEHENTVLDALSRDARDLDSS